MPRIARVVVKNYPYHVTQRGNHRRMFLKRKKNSLTGRTCGDGNFIHSIEEALGREKLKAGKCGRPKKMGIPHL
ncbi:MAG: hypothetical protein M1381_08500 [Deltaproteobacteria bacterium]|nr:hypothetical protein [Deltaproteobacteria bacterium]